MEKLIERINDAIEKETMRTGKMGTETVSVMLILTSEEKMIFIEQAAGELDDHYWWEFDGNELTVRYAEESMNLTGMKWGELTQEQQDTLLMNANCVDGVIGNDAKGGECIVYLTDTLSVSGILKVSDEGEEILINDGAVIYNPEG